MPKLSGATKLEDIPATLELRESHLSNIKDWKVGGKYRVVLEVEQIDLSKGYDGNGPMSARFKVLSAKSAGEVKGEPEKKEAPRNTKLETVKEKASKY